MEDLTLKNFSKVQELLLSCVVNTWKEDNNSCVQMASRVFPFVQVECCVCPLLHITHIWTIEDQSGQFLKRCLVQMIEQKLKLLDSSSDFVELPGQGKIMLECSVAEEFPPKYCKSLFQNTHKKNILVLHYHGSQFLLSNFQLISLCLPGESSNK